MSFLKSKFLAIVLGTSKAASITEMGPFIGGYTKNLLQSN